MARQKVPLGGPVYAMKDILIYVEEIRKLKAKFPMTSWLVDKKGLCAC